MEEEVVVFLLVEWRKERDSLDVVPVEVGDEYMRLDRLLVKFFAQLLAEITETGAAVEDEDLAVDPHLNTTELKTFWKAEEYCETYHVIGGRWLNGSEEILLSVLIRNTGDCRYMSEFNVYRVNAVTGKILQRFTAAEGHKRFGNKYLPLITR